MSFQKPKWCVFMFPTVHIRNMHTKAHVLYMYICFKSEEFRRRTCLFAHIDMHILKATFEFSFPLSERWKLIIAKYMQKIFIHKYMYVCTFIYGWCVFSTRNVHAVWPEYWSELQNCSPASIRSFVKLSWTICRFIFWKVHLKLSRTRSVFWKTHQKLSTAGLTDSKHDKFSCNVSTCDTARKSTNFSGVNSLWNVCMKMQFFFAFMY